MEVLRGHWCICPPLQIGCAEFGTATEDNYFQSEVIHRMALTRSMNSLFCRIPCPSLHSPKSAPNSRVSGWIRRGWVWVWVAQVGASKWLNEEGMYHVSDILGPPDLLGPLLKAEGRAEEMAPGESLPLAFSSSAWWTMACKSASSPRTCHGTERGRRSTSMHSHLEEWIQNKFPKHALCLLSV